MRFLLPLVFLMSTFAGGLVVITMTSPTSPKAAVTDPGSEAEKPNGLSFVLSLLKGEDVALFEPDLPIGALAIYLPEAPAGWDRVGYTTAHGEAITKTTFQDTSTPISDTNKLLGAFDKASRDLQGAALTYQRDDEMIAVMIKSKTSSQVGGLNGLVVNPMAGVFAEIETNIAMASSGFSARPTGFANVHGVSFDFGPKHSRVVASRTSIPINYRTLKATIGRDLTIQVMTNASDAAIADVIAGINIPALNNTLEAPDLTVTPGTGLVTNQTGALSTTPPPPSVAFRAFERLREDVSGLSQDDIRILQQLAMGELDGWIGLYETYGLHYRLSPEMTEFMGEKPILPPVEHAKFAALSMLQNPAIYAPYELEILRNLANRRYRSRERAQRDLSSSRLYAPPLVRLISTLPPEATLEDSPSDNSEPAAVNERELIVRRGTVVQQGEPLGPDCSLELGVRRCIVEETDE